MTSKIGILYGRTSWSEEPQGGVYEKDKDGYYNDHKYEGEIENGKPHGNGTWEMVKRNKERTKIREIVSAFQC